MVTISDDTESPSTSAGALVVSGGVGVAKNINAGGDITGDAGTFSSTLNANGGITVNDGSSDTFTVAAPTGNTVIGGTLSVSGSSQISDDTESPSTSAGALVVSGGVGVAKNINAGGDITGDAGTFSSTLNANGGITVNDGSSDTFTVAAPTGNTVIGGTLSVSGSSQISDDTESPSTSAGALVVSGGVGVAKNINAGGDITGDAGTFSSTLNANGGITVNDGSSDTFTVAAPTGNTVIGGTLSVSGSSQISDDTESPSTSAGALVVSGGVGVAKNINAGGDITGVAGTFSGVVTISDDTQSPSSSAGALMVSGGVGVAKNINAGGATGDAGTFSSTLNANGGITVNDGSSDTFTVAAPTGNTVIGGTLSVSGSSVVDDTDSAAISSGALVVSGGVGVAKNINAGDGPSTLNE